ncbi:hypothetical protein [Burkholderia cepacia]|uniref:hypothetical protein n=1 Tax=Burkholderia cepacia TaxID=292 RepID=UPI0012D96DA2|nr:hypothetical protein [Burkholderia cepacia]
MKSKLSLLLVFLLIWTLDSSASEFELGGGIAIELSDYAYRRTSFDGSTCVDDGEKWFSFVVCFSGKALSKSASENGFKKYSNLSSE